MIIEKPIINQVPLEDIGKGNPFRFSINGDIYIKGQLSKPNGDNFYVTCLINGQVTKHPKNINVFKAKARIVEE